MATELKDDNFPAKVQTAAKIAAETITGGRLFWMAVSATTILLPVQWFFAFICLVGYLILAGIDSSAFFSSADLTAWGGPSYAGGGFFWLGAIGASLCGLVTFLISATIYAKKGFDSMTGTSIIIPPVCLTLLLCPVINFLPVMWLWCLWAAFKGVRP